MEKKEAIKIMKRTTKEVREATVTVTMLNKLKKKRDATLRCWQRTKDWSSSHQAWKEMIDANAQYNHALKKAKK